MNIQYTLSPYTKRNTKWLKYLNIRHDTIKLLAENTGKTSDTDHTNVFLDQSPKATEMKTKRNKWDLVKLTSFCTAKETINKMKGQCTEWEKMLANDGTDKDLVFKIDNPIKKWAEDLNRHVSKEEMQTANRHMKRCSACLIEKCKSKLQ